MLTSRHVSAESKEYTKCHITIPEVCVEIDIGCQHDRQISRIGKPDTLSCNYIVLNEMYDTSGVKGFLTFIGLSRSRASSTDRELSGIYHIPEDNQVP